MAKSGDIKGLDKLLKDLQNLGEGGVDAIAEATMVTAMDIAGNAKILAPVDLSDLSQGIKALEVDKTTWKVQTNATGLAPYSAYMEFGTGGLVEVPEELKDQAIKFIGKGIKKVDLRPRPYLYPSWIKGKKQYLEALEKELNILVRKI